MKPADFSDQAAGQCQKTLEGYYAYSPNGLPPDLPLNWDFVNLISEADRASANLPAKQEINRKKDDLLEEISTRLERKEEVEELFTIKCRAI